MASKYGVLEEDLNKLIERGVGLLEKLHEKKALGLDYEAWYSEAQEVVRQVLPTRLDDFCRLYRQPGTRRVVTLENYGLADFFLGIRVMAYGEPAFDPFSLAWKLLEQQVMILNGVRQRFESSLLEIRLLLQADLFDTELDAAQELAKNGFLRGAGAVAGVVLEGHLAEVCANHKIAIRKKAPHISDFNDALKGAGVIDVPRWRFIQRMGDLRNLCDHKKDREPSSDEVAELIQGVGKLIKELF